jgi:hypothetical protein
LFLSITFQSWAACDVEEAKKADAVLFSFSMTSARSYFEVWNCWIPFVFGERLNGEAGDWLPSSSEASPVYVRPRLYCVGCMCDKSSHGISVALKQQQQSAYILLLIRRFRARECMETLGQVPIDVVKIIMRMIVFMDGPVIMTVSDGKLLAQKIGGSYIHLSGLTGGGVKEALIVFRNWDNNRKKSCVCC